MDRIRRRWPWMAAVLLHAVLLALLALPRRPPAPGPAAMEIEVTAPAPEPRREPVPEPAAAPAPERRATMRAARTAPARRPEPAGGGAMGETADTGPPRSDTDGPERLAPGDDPLGLLGLGWELGALGGGAGGVGAGGAGGARGGGAGGGAMAVRAPPRPISRARPPRLVYPKRFRDERPGEVFVAILTIDEDGWVVGVRLVQGVSPHADQKALTAVWRFHYDPALDAAGRPTRVKVRQRFMVD